MVRIKNPKQQVARGMADPISSLQAFRSIVLRTVGTVLILNPGANFPFSSRREMASTMATYAQKREISNYWFNKANDLYASAAAVWETMGRSSEFPNSRYGLGNYFSMSVACPLVYRMLCGMALELLLKAIIVKSGKEPRPIHNLNTLAQDANVTYSKDDKQLLQILSKAIIWDGRYPVPKEERHAEMLASLKNDCLFDEERHGTMVVFSRNEKLDWESFSDLWQIPFLELAKLSGWIEKQ